MAKIWWKKSGFNSDDVGFALILFLFLGGPVYALAQMFGIFGWGYLFVLILLVSVWVFKNRKKIKE